MKNNKFVFSFDGIASERYLNKKGYYLNPSAINERIKKHSQEYLDKAGGLFIVNNEKEEVGSTKIGVGIFSKTIGDDVVDEISRLIQMIPEGVRKAEEEK